MLCTSLDKNYLPFGKLYLLSAVKNAPDESIYLSTVNLTIDEINWLNQFHPNVVIQNHKIEIPKTIRYRQYMQCRFTHILLEVLEKFKNTDELCIATDVDMLFRKSLIDLYTLIKGNDILLKFDKQHLDIFEIQNAIVVFRSDNPKILQFLKFYNKIWDNRIVKYKDDQLQLFKAWQLFKDSMNFGEIPNDYVDGHFKKDSHIWSSHLGNRFDNYNKFLKELGLPREAKCSNMSWIGKSDGRKEAN